MLEIPFFCADAGSILLTGFEQNLQGAIGRQLVAQHLADGGRAVALVDWESDGKEAMSQMSDMLHSIDADKTTLDRFATIHNVKNYKDADAIQFAIDKRLPSAKMPLMVYRPLAGETTDLRPGDPWLPLAEELAVLLDCRVLTVAHYGRAGWPAPALSSFQADEFWDCKAGINLGVTLIRHVPSALTINLEGKVTTYGPLNFENVEVKGFSHV